MPYPIYHTNFSSYPRAGAAQGGEMGVEQFERCIRSDLVDLGETWDVFKIKERVTQLGDEIMLSLISPFPVCSCSITCIQWRLNNIDATTLFDRNADVAIWMQAIT